MEQIQASIQGFQEDLSAMWLVIGLQEARTLSFKRAKTFLEKVSITTTSAPSLQKTHALLNQSILWLEELHKKPQV